MRKFQLFIFLFIGLGSTVYCQENIPVESWRTHFSYYTTKLITIADEQIYAAGTNSLFYYDKSDNSITLLSKSDGLSNTSVQTLDFDPLSKTLVISFANSEINLIKGTEIVVLDALKDIPPNDPKQLYHVSFNNNIAYLSTAFGITTIDLKKKNIVNIYKNLGVGGSTVPIYQTNIFEGHIYATIDGGVISAKIAPDINLKDFNQWKRYGTADGLPAGKPIAIASGNGTLLLGYHGDGLYQLIEDKWVKTDFLTGAVITDLNFSGNGFSLVQDQKVYRSPDGQSFQQIDLESGAAPLKAKTDDKGETWIAGTDTGLMRVLAGNVDRILPEGPFSDKISALKIVNNKLIVMPGKYEDNATNKISDGFYVYEKGKWQNFHPEIKYNTLPMPNVDILDATYDAVSRNYFFGTRQGMLELDKAGNFNIFNQSNSPLNTTVGDLVKTTATVADTEGNIWVANYQVPLNTPVYHVYRKDKTWESLRFPLPNAAYYPVQLLIDSNGFKWVRINPNNGGGILVFSEKTNTSKYITTETGKGNLPHIKVNSMDMDREGAIWAGTDKGIAIFNTNYSSLFIYAGFPIFEFRPLFWNEKINVIKVDGGNRKWIGTNRGLWLFNAEGSELIHHFNITNSPLLSNEIIDIAIHPTTGEVFIGTDKGIVSYRSGSSVGTPFHENVRVFPNPVHPGYSGLVAIDGLAENASVKITDISGKLIFQTQAAGGTATWNLLNKYGQKAKSGVYLIFSASLDGTDAMVSKLAIID